MRPLTEHSSFIISFQLWFDEYLTWNKSDFEGTEKFFVKATNLWLPDIEPLNA